MGRERADALFRPMIRPFSTHDYLQKDIKKQWRENTSLHYTHSCFKPIWQTGLHWRLFHTYSTVSLQVSQHNQGAVEPSIVPLSTHCQMLSWSQYIECRVPGSFLDIFSTICQSANIWSTVLLFALNPACFLDIIATVLYINQWCIMCENILLQWQSRLTPRKLMQSILSFNWCKWILIWFYVGRRNPYARIVFSHSNSLCN